MMKFYKFNEKDRTITKLSDPSDLELSNFQLYLKKHGLYADDFWKSMALNPMGDVIILSHGHSGFMRSVLNLQEEDVEGYDDVKEEKYFNEFYKKGYARVSLFRSKLDGKYDTIYFFPNVNRQSKKFQTLEMMAILMECKLYEISDFVLDFTKKCDLNEFGKSKYKLVYSPPNDI